MRKPIIQSEPSRRGFTLLELMIVIAIIAVLMSMSFYVMNGITEGAEKEATTTTIHKINRLLEQRIEAFDRAFKGSRRNAYVTATVGLLALIDGRFDYYRVHPEDAPPAIVILARKAGFRFEFPQRMVELILVPSDDANGDSLPDSVESRIAYPNARAYLIAADQASSAPTPNFEPTATEITDLVNARWAGGSCSAMIGGVSQTFTFTGHQQITESSELLYYMLVAAGSFGSSSVDADQFSDAEVKDTDDDGLPEFVDAWNQPLRYYRWPTRLIDPTAPNPFTPIFTTINDNTEIDLTPDGDESDGLREIVPAERQAAYLLMRGLPPAPVAFGGLAMQRDMLLVDPDDPVGLLYSFIEDPNYQSLGIDLTQEINEGKYHTLDTYHVPLIVSGGPDEQLGLYEPNEVDYDINGNGSVDAGEETAAGFVNGTFDGILGNLAQYKGTFVTSDGDGTTETPVAGVLTDRR
ncbi:MAG: type II secretion system protein [Planctomycetaceae bacterium]